MIHMSTAKYTIDVLRTVYARHSVPHRQWSTYYMYIVASWKFRNITLLHVRFLTICTSYNFSYSVFSTTYKGSLKHVHVMIKKNESVFGGFFFCVFSCALIDCVSFLFCYISIYEQINPYWFTIIIYAISLCKCHQAASIIQHNYKPQNQNHRQVET